MSRYGRLTVALAGPIAAAALAACGSSSLSGASTCADFMKASPSAQQAVVDKLATQYNKPDYTTPLGAPEVPSFCSANPSTTLQQFFQQAGA